MTTYTVDLFSTLDGYGSGRVAYWGKEGPELVEQRARLTGRKTRRWSSARTPTACSRSSLRRKTIRAMRPLNEAQKIVISRTLEEPLTWANSTLIAEDALDAVPRLKAESPRSAPTEASQ